MYELYYWPGIQGRGEYVRLALEEAGAPYRDMALVPEDEGGGVAGMMKLLEGEDVARPPFAPPFLKTGRQLIGQTANILLFLGPRHGLTAGTASGQLWVHQLQLTIADFIVEIHDTHHPVASSLYYHDQKPEAKRRTEDFLAHRLPKFLGYFDTVVERGKGSWLTGKRLTYADLSLAQVVAGLAYAFPESAPKMLKKCRRVAALHDAVFARPAIASYVASGRRLPFNNDDLFRRYDELPA
jgi:glutathione S-transferase